MSKTITLTEHRPADGLLTMRVRNTTYNVNIFFNPNAKNTLDTQMRKIIQKEAKAGNFWIYSCILIFYLDKRQPKGTILVECGKMLQRGAPKLGKDGKPMKDKHGKVIYEPYRIKVLNTINFRKSMHYNRATCSPLKRWRTALFQSVLWTDNSRGGMKE